MKCPICNGSGIDNRCDRLSCYECGGSGELEQTNEEWIHSMTTEELAEFIRKQRDDWSDGWYSDWHPFGEIVEWLKEKHNESSMD